MRRKIPKQIIELSSLGPRICIIGPSNSGKSTLAALIGRKTAGKVVHLDQLAHKPHTNWERRNDAEFLAAHDSEIRNDAWVIEGNYGICMPQRFDRATAVIWLDPPLVGCTFRFFMRSLRNDMNRVGKLQGSKKEFSLALLKYTWFNYPKNKLKYTKLLESFEGNFIKIDSLHDLNQLIDSWGLE
jgi:adenylate kinase family enzyme